MQVAIWLDDIRDPESYAWKDLIEAYAPGCHILWAKSFDDFVDIFNMCVKGSGLELKTVFFDNDLGGGKEGRHAFTWMEERIREIAETSGVVDVPRFRLYAQTSNPAAKKELHVGFQSLERFWDEQGM